MRTPITRIDCKIATLEEKEELTDKDRQSVPKTLKTLEELRAEFKSYHYAVIEQVEEEPALTEEQTTLDEFGEKLEELIDRLSELVTTPEPTETLAPVLANETS